MSDENPTRAQKQADYQQRTKSKDQIKYAKENIWRIPFGVNRKTEQDIVSHLETIENKSGYIKNLIRDDIDRKNQ